MKVACSALAYFSASTVSLLLMVTWSFSSVSAAAEGPHHPVAPGVAVADRVAQGEPGRMAVGLELAAQVEELVEVGGDRRRSRPRRPRTCGRPPARRRRRSAWRSSRPPRCRSAARSATSRHTSRRDRWRDRRVGRILSAYLCGSSDQARAMSGPSPTVAADGDLRPQILPALEVDLDGDAGRVGELLGVLEVHRLVARRRTWTGAARAARRPARSRTWAGRRP